MHEISAACENYIRMAEKYFKRTFARPAIKVNLRGKAAGQARLDQAELRFNRILYEENRDHFIKQTVGHEVAHWIAYCLWGNVRPHGSQWQQIMQQVFNLPAIRLHTYDVGRVQGQTYPYRCNCRHYQLSTRRHRAILRGRYYLCRDCGAVLVAVEDDNVPRLPDQ
ncbi:SprT family zinc-dependent metalloprotease [Celerinatantimonas diazotrophica]|uniref:SprT protein n=1 Tax=Celerinatantimonas diazotrophica TaxID=412034 RepID=A0A4V6NE22_9GAMM|nr:SprT family zinc-dependent metalloprotease [Celerinatantimonas diazotrophica]TCK46991.1 SprT protein [Celerinatantimonas diazotrophica]CAG9295759.1 Protein SprT [Celerinatantimonas diazotrophica]